MTTIKKYKALVKKHDSFLAANEVEDSEILSFHVDAVSVRTALEGMLKDFKGGNNAKVYKMLVNTIDIITNVQAHVKKNIL